MIAQQFDIMTVDELFDQLKLFFLTTVRAPEVRRLSDFDIIFEHECLIRLKLEKSESQASVSIELGKDLEELSARAVEGEDTFPFRLEADSLVRASLEFSQEINEILVTLIGDFPKTYKTLLALRTCHRQVTHRNHLSPTGGEFMKCGG